MLTYLVSPDGHMVRAGSSGIPTGATWAPATIDPGDQSSPWPVDEVLRTGAAANVERQVIGWLADQGGKSPEVARGLPLQGADGRQPSGVMIVGLSGGSRPGQQRGRGVAEMCHTSGQRQWRWNRALDSPSIVRAVHAG
jgi:hypothetical protein